MAVRAMMARPIGLAATLMVVAAGCAPSGAPTGPTPSGTVTGSAAPTAAPAASIAPVPGASATPATGSPAPGASVAPSLFRVSGLVANIDRDLMPGVPVTAKRGETVVTTAQTDKDGSYFLDLAPGDYTITTTKPGHTNRSQAVKVQANMVLNFGPSIGDQANPFWLADTPEIDHVEVEEAGPGGPLTLRVHLSEPLPKDSQENFDEIFALRAGQDTEFLRTGPSGDARLRTTSKWSADGQVYTFQYDGPYLASGATDTTYSVKLIQRILDTQDPITREFEWTDMGVEDKDGNALGRGRAEFAFRRPNIFPPAAEMLTDEDFGYYVQDRRWRLSHDGAFTFKAGRDETPPALERVELNVNEEFEDGDADVLTLTFSEPMSVAQDRKETEWTRLDKDRPFVILNVTRNVDGKNLEPVSEGLRARKVEVDYLDPRIVYLHYPLNYFEEFEFVEVTLTPDAQDPVGNPPDPKRNRLGGRIVGG